MAALIKKLFRPRRVTAKKPVSGAVPDKETRKQVAERSTAQEAEKAATSEQLEFQARQLRDNPSEQDLQTLALEGKTAALRLQAAEKLASTISLQAVQKAAKGRDKGVYQVVRQRLQARRDEEAELQRQADAVTAAVAQARDLAGTDDVKLYQARLEALLNQWESLKTAASTEQTTVFLEHIRHCRGRLQEQQARAADQQRAADQKSEREQTLAMLESTLDELKKQPEEQMASLSSLDALQKTQENRWLEATRDVTVEKAEQRQYEELMRGLKAYMGAVRRMHQQQANIDAVLAQQSQEQPAEPPSAQDLNREIDWPEGFRVPASLAQLRRVTPAGDAAGSTAKTADPGRQQQTGEKLGGVLDNLESALEAKQLRQARQHFKQVQQLQGQLEPGRARGFQARVNLLHGQLRELQDWQGFATRPKQIDLCEQMEYLADQHMEPEAKAEKIHDLQTRWKALGGSSERELWQRFKSASDTAYEPCKEYFAAKSGLKKNNLNTRRTLCEELDAFIQNTDFDAVDWKNVEQISRTAKQEWKAAWPVEFRENRPLQKQFDQLIEKLDEPLSRERSRNEALKADIVARAESLISHEPLADAMQQAKALQAQWRAVGITRHKEDRKLWRAFRRACDTIFARREGEKQAQQAQQREQQVRAEEKRQAKLEQWVSYIEQPPADTTELPGDWLRRAEPLADLPLRELVIRAEIQSGCESPESDQPRRMEIQMQRLTEGLAGQGSEDTRLAGLQELIAAWCLVAQGTAQDTELTRRLVASVRSVVE